jgi:hypothetical protein
VNVKLSDFIFVGFALAFCATGTAQYFELSSSLRAYGETRTLAELEMAEREIAAIFADGGPKAIELLGLVALKLMTHEMSQDEVLRKLGEHGGNLEDKAHFILAKMRMTMPLLALRYFLDVCEAEAQKAFLSNIRSQSEPVLSLRAKYLPRPITFDEVRASDLGQMPDGALQQGQKRRRDKHCSFE